MTKETKQQILRRIVAASSTTFNGIETSVAEQAMSEYAEQEAVAFRDWCDKHAWYHDHLEHINHTTSQLFQIFKSQQK